MDWINHISPLSLPPRPLAELGAIESSSKLVWQGQQCFIGYISTTVSLFLFFKFLFFWQEPLPTWYPSIISVFNLLSDTFWQSGNSKAVFLFDQLTSFKKPFYRISCFLLLAGNLIQSYLLEYLDFSVCYCLQNGEDKLSLVTLILILFTSVQ